ncbi:hypothetical protein C8Q78DRAFT_982173 [Trametes maxima]|nr:hypothetical protein C8Q78DRAFT_982173 [Trametes maxima]
MTLTNVQDVASLFPLPSAPPSLYAPARLPGVTHVSGTALADVLKDNHVKWHAFFNDRGFHNHASHHLVAIYALGAGGPLIDAAYQTHAVYMRPAFDSPEPITEKNVWLHLGKREFYNSYLEYFRTVLRIKDVTDVLEEYIFSAKANVGGAGVVGEPQMLNRFYSALVHPMIHTGCGLEFGLLGLVAEGLAQTAVHPVQGGNLIPKSLFHQGGSVERLAALLPSLSLNRSASAPARSSVHAFTILARVLAEPKFSAKNLGLPLVGDLTHFDKVNEVLGHDLVKLSDEWVAELDGNGATAAVVQTKIEELAWMNALIYGVGGWSGRDRAPGGAFNADFFYMHLVTSSLFLPTFVAYLSPRSSILLLRTFFTTSLTWYLAQGRAALPIGEFYKAVTAMPTPPGPVAVPVKGTLTPGDIAPNPWLPIVQTTIAHPGEHLCKLQRALLHNATLYGTREAGFFAGTGLEGAELLDGTLFIRAAGLSATRLGWMKEGEKEGEWDRTGFNY